MPLSSLRFWRSKPAPPPAATAPRRAPRRAAAEPAPRDPDTERARTRQRLLGAAVLLGLGVLIFGLLFETEPRSADGPSAAQLARRDAGPVLGALPAPAAPASADGAVEPLPAPASEVAAPPAAAGPGVEEPPAVSTAPAAAPAAASVELAAAPATVRAPPQVSAGVRPPAPSAAGPSTTPSTTPPTPASAPPPPAAAPRAVPDDGARARALLEGRTASPAAGVAPGAPPAAGAGAAPRTAASARHVVQVGAYSSASTLREARQRVERLGLKTYIQEVQTPAGPRTRLRVGPFDDRAQAEAAAAKLRAARLPADLLTL